MVFILFILFLSDLLRFEDISHVFCFFIQCNETEFQTFQNFQKIKLQNCLFCFLSRFLQTHKLDPSSHYLRLKVWNAGQMLFYVPKLEEDVSDVVRKHTL